MTSGKSIAPSQTSSALPPDKQREAIPDMGTETVRVVALKFAALMHVALLWLMPLEDE